ncbi:hypothetical protein E4T66_02560 [Sinimarinibacterium sp. CAU 1509]|uniref:hypothetical protein n=1 Tax=Sinimarinibacterium sp. CAU 1509 TaxID=2562283 RepID=UPI0010AC539F|nr:hypothetical protein [Sinimarinibacterium sp. CAU 1509]TJY65126.1 hypothetical protein E4T66_02560 [Sinimarinibacterium sp. CAU 1509]
MNAYRPFLLTLALCALHPAHAAPPPEVQPFTQCRSLSGDDERLICYDNAAAAWSEPAAVPVTPSSPMPIAQTVSPTPQEPASAPPPATAPAPAAPIADFGAESLPKTGVDRDKAPPDEIHSRILGEFRGWEAKTRFELENGQVWECVNCRSVSLLKQNPEVTIRRGFISGYWLKIDGLNTQAPVRRIK